jgi:hypothetical protein
VTRPGPGGQAAGRPFQADALGAHAQQHLPPGQHEHEQAEQEGDDDGQAEGLDLVVGREAGRDPAEEDQQQDDPGDPPQRPDPLTQDVGG